MASFEYNPFCEGVILTLRCPQCRNEFTQFIEVPSPDWDGETSRDSSNSNVVEIECPRCTKCIDVSLNSSINGGDGFIPDLDDEDLFKVEEYFPLDDDFDEWVLTQTIDSYFTETRQALNDIDSLPEASQKLLYRMLFANVIGTMESYLSEKLLKAATSNEESQRKFFSCYEPFSKQDIKLSNIFKQYDNRDRIIIDALRKLMYHDLGKIAPIYNKLLGVKFDKSLMKDIMAKVMVRHDIVHRNGINKETGKCHNIGKQEVTDLISLVYSFIKDIENQCPI